MATNTKTRDTMFSKGPVENSFIVAEYMNTMVLFFECHYYVVTLLKVKGVESLVNPWSTSKHHALGITSNAIIQNGMHCDSEAIAMIEFNKIVDDINKYL